ncbi:MAG TPA: ABC transporter permease [Candidatus Acidoferrales bacterium]|nr:ABC transporter permease [Candidatus Acidoferrales bacterium]
MSDPANEPIVIPEAGSKPPRGPRDNRLMPNAWIVAKRELSERVRSRLFLVSTLLLATLAVGVALTPLLVRLADRGTTSTIAIVTSDDALASRTISIMGGILNATSTDPDRPPAYAFVRAGDPATIVDEVASGHYDAALEASRDPSGRITFRFLTGASIGPDRAQLVGVGTLAVAIIDWTAANNTQTTKPFLMPTLDLVAAAGPTAGGQPIGAAEFASRRIVGVVFVVLIFITLVIYGMWVAAGVVAEKSSRVMELLISAASPAQLVTGKVIGIGLAGLIQYVGILVPALLTLLVEDRLAGAVLGLGGPLGVDLGIVSPALIAAYGGFWILGFILYSLIYAAAGSLVSRAEDLQVLALPLSLIAIAGYLQAVMALSGGITTFMRVSSLVPFWSPFIMLTRLTVGRAEPWEIVASYALLVAAIVVTGVVAVRVYSAGVLLYGQRPGLRAIVGAVVSPPV